MEAVTVGGLAIVIFGLWIEFEPQWNQLIRFVSRAMRGFSCLSAVPLTKPSYQRLS